MERPLNDAFNSRSKDYQNEMNWILDHRFIDCFAIPVYKNGVLLDAGAGSGILAKKCYDMGWDVTAVDVNRSMMKRIPNGIKKSFQMLEHLDFSDNNFDVTVCRQVLQYTDIGDALKSMTRVTKKELRLGHIKFLHLEDKLFWEELFRLANPFRKHIFCRGEDLVLSAVKEQELPLKVINHEEFVFSDILLSPLKYEKNLYDKLCKMILNQGDAFISRNNILFCENDEVYCDRLWSFIVLEICSD